jgi:hypothetical protein
MRRQFHTHKHCARGKQKTKTNLEEVPLVVKVDAYEIVGVDGERAILHGPEPANHHGGNRVPGARMRPRGAQGDPDHVELEHVVYLQVASVSSFDTAAQGTNPAKTKKRT